MTVAGVVTFEPDLKRLRENLDAIVSQVTKVILYDNGSSNFEAVRHLVEQIGNVVLLDGGVNRGIAHALNELSEQALGMGEEWIITLDQDSVSKPDMVKVLERYRDATVGLVCPFIVDRNKQNVGAIDFATLPEIQEFKQPARKGAITSGALMQLRAWSDVGGFDDAFFIDYVDYDLNQRLMSKGYKILRSNRTYLLHEVGHATPTWLRVPRKDITGVWHLEQFYSFGHSPFRCYYKARNRVLFTRKYGRDLGITHEGIWQIPQQVLLTLLFEKERLAKFSAFLRGFRDGLTYDASLVE